MQSKAGISQLNLLHRNNNKTVGKQKKQKSIKKQVGSEVLVNSRGIRAVSPEEEKYGYGGKDLQKWTVLSLE